jgi:RHS repeat-associated protein
MDAPGGGRTSFSYDAARRIAWLLNPYSERSTFLNDSAGRRTAIQLANGTTTSYLYDQADRLNWIINKSPSGATLSSFNYRVDNVGNRAGVVEASGDIVSWAYDSAYQLINELRTGTLGYDTTFTYDPAGNRLTQYDGITPNTYTYDAANQQSTWSAPTFLVTNTYDQNGNLITGLSTYPSTYTWDFENRMTVANLLGGPQSISTHVYDADHRRVRGTATNSGSTIDNKYVWDAENTTIYTDGNDTMLGMYTYEPETFGLLISQRFLGTPSFYIFDAVASVRHLCNGLGGITDSYIYKAFGDVVVQSGGTPTLWAFGGQVGYILDAASGKYLARRRWMSSSIGRWLSRDPMLFSDRSWPPAGPSLFETAATALQYPYSENNPVGKIDPSGLWCTAWGLVNFCAPTIQDHVNCDLACRAQGKPGGKAGSCTIYQRTCTILICTVGSQTRKIQCLCSFNARGDKFRCSAKARGNCPPGCGIFRATGRTMDECKRRALAACQAAGCHTPGGKPYACDCGHAG